MLEWLKSSYCGASDCVQVAWRKASASTVHGACVEVGWNKSSHCASGECMETAYYCGQIHVRDSKNPDGGMLSFSPQDWEAFIKEIKSVIA